MINKNAMRALVLSAAGVLCAAAAAQQPMPGGSPSMPNTPNAPNNPNSPTMPNSDAGMTPSTDSPEHKQQDMLFVHDAAEGGMMEVQLGQLAAQKATNPNVKSFGQKMVADHTALNNAMKPIADKLGVKVPERLNKKDQAMYDKMNALSGADFDNAYIEDMVKDHRKDLSDFTMEAQMASDPDLRALVQRGSVMIKEHSDMIDKIAKDNGVAAKGH
jgi:putative membrane protein